MSFPHEAILVFNFFSALVDAFPYHSWPSATRDMGKCINACCEKVEHSNCLMWKSYISVWKFVLSNLMACDYKSIGNFGTKTYGIVPPH